MQNQTTNHQEKQSSSDSAFLVVVKGVLMGAVEIVPGVSAGTLALITGILPRFINALNHIDFQALRYLFRGELRPLWQYIDGNFLLLLATGLFSGFILLLQLITFLLEHHPIPLWSFFFGLILASSIWLALQIRHWKRFDILVSFLLGFAFALWITLMSEQQVELKPLYVFIAGMIAISAMMLPGLSGSFMLMLMGMYASILNALKTLQWDIIISFMGGAGIGIILFSHLLAFLFHRFPSQIYALLTGLMLGSLNRIWPWQEVIRYRVNSHGELKPMMSRSISPFRYEMLNDTSSQLVFAIIAMISGLIVMWFMSRMKGVLADEKILRQENP